MTSIVQIIDRKGATTKKLREQWIVTHPESKKLKLSSTVVVIVGIPKISIGLGCWIPVYIRKLVHLAMKSQNLYTKGEEGISHTWDQEAHLGSWWDLLVLLAPTPTG